ncbi:MAG: serine/threonine-protein kinase [Candidatus Thiodiazotropha sp.]
MSVQEIVENLPDMEANFGGLIKNVSDDHEGGNLSPMPDNHSDAFLEETDRPLPEVINQNTRYLFLHNIGSGGKSVINACKDRHLNRVVAYKSLRPEFVDDEVENIRLLREARVSAMFQHPNTIPIYEAGRDNHGHYYFTMKLVRGYTLRKILGYREHYDLSQLMEVFEQVSHGLARAHDLHVAHRDIKPENILVGCYGEVLLMDWGLAKVWGKNGGILEEPLGLDLVAESDRSMTGHGKVQGTLCYMSPEQLHRDPDITISTDIYSLGSVLYELLTGQTPFESDKTYELLDMLEHKVPAKPSSISEYPVPKVLEELCMNCLEKDPANRPNSISEVMRAVEHWSHP